MDFLEYNFEATIKMLVILSSQPRKRIDAMGLGDTEDEIAMDYHLYFTSNKDAFVDQGYLTQKLAEKLMEIDIFFEARSGSNRTAFWDSIETHKDWEILRLMAKDCLKSLGKGDVDIDINTTNEIAPDGTGIVTQTVKIDLVGNGT